MKLEFILEPIQSEFSLLRQSLKKVAEVDFPQLAELLDYALGSAGKGIRPALTLLCGKFYRYDLDLLLPAATAVELLHIASLIHDDTIDKAHLRRGLPTLNRLWGDDIAMLAGDWLFAKSAELVTLTGVLKLVQLLSQTLMAISQGELEETWNAFKVEQSRQDYLHRVGNKTASLFAFATQSGAILSQGPENVVSALKTYGYKLGIAFQIVDDILDFTADEQGLGKPVGKDLPQGIPTLPVIIFLEQHPENNPVKAVLERQGGEEELKQALATLRSSPAIEEAHRIAQAFSQEARQAIEFLPQTSAKKALLDLADYVVERQK